MEEDVNSIKRKGLVMAILGVIFIFVASWLSTLNMRNFAIHFFETLLEPAGWFTAWTGMDQLFYTAYEHKADLDFYKKMADAEIKFSSY